MHCEHVNCTWEETFFRSLGEQNARIICMCYLIPVNFKIPLLLQDNSIQKLPFQQKPGDISSVWNPPSIYFQMLFGYVIRNQHQRLFEYLLSTCHLPKSITSASPCNNPSPPSLCRWHKVHALMWIQWLFGYNYDACDHLGPVHYVVWSHGG